MLQKLYWRDSVDTWWFWTWQRRVVFITGEPGSPLGLIYLDFLLWRFFQHRRTAWLFSVNLASAYLQTPLRWQDVVEWPFFTLCTLCNFCKYCMYCRKCDLLQIQIDRRFVVFCLMYNSCCVSLLASLLHSTVWLFIKGVDIAGSFSDLRLERLCCLTFSPPVFQQVVSCFLNLRTGRPFFLSFFFSLMWS